MAADDKDDGYWQGYPPELLEKAQKSWRTSQKPNYIITTPHFEDTSESDASQDDSGSDGTVRARGQRADESGYQQVYTRSKSHVVAGLLAIFLGGFGIHKFFLGYNSTGVIMITVTVLGSFLTFGLAAVIMGVIGVVEGIIYLATSQLAFDRIYVYNKRTWF